MTLLSDVLLSPPESFIKRLGGFAEKARNDENYHSWVGNLSSFFEAE
jgi:hypothetical protein